MHARIYCKSASDTLAEMICGQDAVVVTCSPISPPSLLRFHFDAARQLIHCSAKCGDQAYYFELPGILKYAGNVHVSIRSLIDGNSTIFNDFQWPDLEPITYVVIRWYKTLFIGLICVVLALIVTYVGLQAMGLLAVRIVT